MSLTNDQLQARIEATEAVVNDMQTAVNNLASKSTLNSLLNIRQAEIDDLTTRVTALESRVSVLETA